jgi:hypothetical protein
MPSTTNLEGEEIVDAPWNMMMKMMMTNLT